MLYLDSNAFVYASLDRLEGGRRARSLLKEVQQGRLRASTSALTFDELVWAVKKHRNIEHAIAAGNAFLNMPNLSLVDVDGDILSLVLELMNKHKLDPRDSIHAASSISVGAEAIVSADQHFDRLKEIRRRPI